MLILCNIQDKRQQDQSYNMLAVIIDQYIVNTNLDDLLSQSVRWPRCQLLFLGPLYKSFRFLSFSPTLPDYHKLSVSLLCQLHVRNL